MKLRDFLKQFEGMDQDLPVCLADWQEAFLDPSEWAAQHVSVRKGTYWEPDAEMPGWHKADLTEGTFILIGPPR